MTGWLVSGGGLSQADHGSESGSGRGAGGNAGSGPVRQRCARIDLEAAEEPDGRAIYWAIYAEETPVGFVMIADEVGSPDYIAHYLWKLLIDERYQRRGFGTATLDLIVEYFRDRGVAEMWTSAGQGEGSPVTFYERYGFERTGEIVFEQETLLRLEIS